MAVHNSKLSCLFYGRSLAALVLVMGHQTLFTDAFTPKRPTSPSPRIPGDEPSPPLPPSPVPFSPEPFNPNSTCIQPPRYWDLALPPVPQGSCTVFNEQEQVLTSSTRSCEECIMQCLTWGTTQSPCHSITYTDSPYRLNRLLLAFFQCGTTPPLESRDDSQQALCVLLNGQLGIENAKNTTCNNCRQHAQGWSVVEYMVFGGQDVPRGFWDTFCEAPKCPIEDP